MKIRLGDLRRIIREVAGGLDPVTVAHRAERIRRAATAAAEPGVPPASIAGSFYRRVQHELPRDVSAAQAVAAFTDAASRILGPDNLKYSLGPGAAEAKAAVVGPLVDALVAAATELVETER
jgi:hypothetical protein